MVGGELVPAHEAALARQRLKEHSRSDLPRPNIRPDGMDTTWNPADGRHYESRSAYEQAVKEAGCEIMGDDDLQIAPPPDVVTKEDIAQDIKVATEQVEQGMEQPPLQSVEEYSEGLTKEFGTDMVDPVKPE